MTYELLGILLKLSVCVFILKKSLQFLKVDLVTFTSEHCIQKAPTMNICKPALLQLSN